MIQKPLPVQWIFGEKVGGYGGAGIGALILAMAIAYSIGEIKKGAENRAKNRERIVAKYVARSEAEKKRNK